MRSESRMPSNYRSRGRASENYLHGIPVSTPGVKITSPMKARVPLLLVFAATLGLPGSVAAQGSTADPPPSPTPASAPSESAPAPAPTPSSSTSATSTSAPRPITQLSKKEAAARLKALPEEQQKWLEYVDPI